MLLFSRKAVVVILSISSLVAVVIFGLPHGNPANFVPFAPSGLIGLLRATGLIFFAYTGYSRIATLVEEVRTIPFRWSTWCCANRGNHPTPFRFDIFF